MVVSFRNIVNKKHGLATRGAHILLRVKSLALKALLVEDVTDMTVKHDFTQLKNF